MRALSLSHTHVRAIPGTKQQSCMKAVINLEGKTDSPNPKHFAQNVHQAC